MHGKPTCNWTIHPREHCLLFSPLIASPHINPIKNFSYLTGNLSFLHDLNQPLDSKHLWIWMSQTVCGDMHFTNICGTRPASSLPDRGRGVCTPHHHMHSKPLKLRDPVGIPKHWTWGVPLQSEHLSIHTPSIRTDNTHNTNTVMPPQTSGKELLWHRLQTEKTLACVFWVFTSRPTSQKHSEPIGLSLDRFYWIVSQKAKQKQNQNSEENGNHNILNGRICTYCPVTHYRPLSPHSSSPSPHISSLLLSK